LRPPSFSSLCWRIAPPPLLLHFSSFLSSSSPSLSLPSPHSHAPRCCHSPCCLHCPPCPPRSGPPTCMGHSQRCTTTVQIDAYSLDRPWRLSFLASPSSPARIWPRLAAYGSVPRSLHSPSASSGMSCPRLPLLASLASGPD
jgi:hypothetical protein